MKVGAAVRKAGVEGVEAGVEEVVRAAAPKAEAGEPVARRGVGEPGALAYSRHSLLGSDFALCHLPSPRVGREGDFVGFSMK